VLLLRQPPRITSVIATAPATGVAVGLITRQVHGRDARGATGPTADQQHHPVDLLDCPGKLLAALSGVHLDLIQALSQVPAEIVGELLSGVELRLELVDGLGLLGDPPIELFQAGGVLLRVQAREVGVRQLDLVQAFQHVCLHSGLEMTQLLFEAVPNRRLYHPGELSLLGLHVRQVTELI
jgi:hypothetical protein